MMTASVAEDDSTAAENSFVYPLLFIAGMRMEPSAAASATADPEISAKNIEVTMVTWASAPRTHPSSAEDSAISRREIPDAFMIAPARMKSGIAMSGKLVAPVYMAIGALGSAATPPVWKIAIAATTPSAMAIGTLTKTRRSTAPKRTKISISALPVRAAQLRELRRRQRLRRERVEGETGRQHQALLRA